MGQALCLYPSPFDASLCQLVLRPAPNRSAFVSPAQTSLFFLREWAKWVLTSTTSCLQLVGQQKRDKWLLCVPVKMLLQRELSSRQWNSSNLYKPKFNIGHYVLQLCHKTPQLGLQKFSALVRGLELFYCPGALSGAEVHWCPAKPLLVVSFLGNLNLQVFSENASCGSNLKLRKASTNLCHCYFRRCAFVNFGGDLEWCEESNSALLIYMMPYTDTIQVLGIFTILK